MENHKTIIILPEDDDDNNIDTNPNAELPEPEEWQTFCNCINCECERCGEPIRNGHERVEYYWNAWGNPQGIWQRYCDECYNELTK